MASGFNFARQPFENERLPRLVFTLSAALVLGVTLVHGFFLGRYLVREQEALDITVSELEGEIEAADAAIARTEASLAEKQTALGDERTRFLTRIYRHKSFSWTGLFNELEEITPAAVRITSIAPFEEDGEIAVTLTLVGRTLANVLEMVSALEGSRFFATVFPLDEVDLAEIGDGRETGVAATLRLRYVAPPADEPDAAPEDADPSGDAPEVDAGPLDEDDTEPIEEVDDEPVGEVDEEMQTPSPTPEAQS
jgi:Tfp pilus assembly protein PilN